MLEIKIDMEPARPAVEAQPARPKGYRVELDGTQVKWGEKPWPAALHLYGKGWMNSPGLTPLDFRMFAALFHEIADTLEAQKGTEQSDNVAHS